MILPQPSRAAPHTETSSTAVNVCLHSAELPWDKWSVVGMSHMHEYADLTCSRRHSYDITCTQRLHLIHTARATVREWHTLPIATALCGHALRNSVKVVDTDIFSKKLVEVHCDPTQTYCTCLTSSRVYPRLSTHLPRSHTQFRHGPGSAGS